MRRLLFFLLPLLVCGSPLRAHEIGQVFFRMSLGEEEWRGVVELDALMVLEMMGGGKVEEDGTNGWLAGLGEDEVKAFFEDTRSYWRERFVMEVGGVPCPYEITLPDPLLLQKDVASSPQEGALVRLTATGTYPPNGGPVEVLWKDEELPYLVVGFREEGGGGGTAMEPVEFGDRVKIGEREQRAGEASVTTTAPPSLWGWVKSGFHHILPLGLDHIAFVLGLFLLSPRWRPLLAQSATFTVAHSLTLGLVVTGVFSVSGDIVEPLIALSIVYVAVENLFVKELKPWRLWLIFAFGLLHGMGFAGVMSELDIPEGEILRPLLGFNIGVELGQIAVFALAFLVTGWFLKREKVWQAIRWTVSLLIALTGLYWTVERVLL